MFGLHNHNLGPSLRYNVFGYNTNLNAILSIDFCINPCSQKSAKLRFTNIQDLCSNFFAWKPFLESSSPDIFALSETNLEHPIGSNNFSIRGYLPLIRKDFFAHMNGLTVYVKEGLSFAC